MGKKSRQELLKIKALSARSQAHPFNTVAGSVSREPVSGVTASGIPFFRRAGSRISLVPVTVGGADSGDHP